MMTSFNSSVAKGSPLDFSKIQRVLITKLRFHGDVLLSSPVFTLLKKHYPHLKIDGLIYIETQDMLSLHPAIDTIFTVDRSWKKQGFKVQFEAERKLFSKLKAKKYDLIIHLTEDWRGLFLKRLLNIPFAICADYERRRSNKFWLNSFTHIYSEPHNRPKVLSHLDSLKQLGIRVDLEDSQLSLEISAEDRRVVSDLLANKGLKDKSYILIHPTSRFFYKCWPPNTCAQLINALQKKGVPVVLTAAPAREERLYIEQVKADLKLPVIDFSGQLSLKQLAAVIDYSHCFIGVDSAPMHIASAMQTPLIALFGVTNTKIWAPVSQAGQQVEIMQSSSLLEKPAKVNGTRPNTLDNCILDITWQKVLSSALRYFQ